MHERRRDKANDALYQMTYYLDRILRQIERNGIEIEAEEKRAIGDISWTQKNITSKDSN
ncbi:MAG: hypothetical protein AAFV93_15665 [Chloroflexota bacterium]